MIGIIVVGGLALVIGALLISAFAVLAASPLTSEGTPSRAASPAMTRFRDSDCVTNSAPARSGFVHGLVRSLSTSRKAVRGTQRGTTS